MELRVLGGVEATLDGKPVALGRRRERLLLGILLLEVNRVVSSDRLAELIWANELPPSPSRVLQVYASRLGKALSVGGSDGPRLVRRGGGYVVEVAAESVDIHRFEVLVHRARQSDDPIERQTELRNALALWRGSPLADVASDEVQARVCRAAEELHWSAIEMRVGADLVCGRHDELLPELAELTERFPTRERLVVARMIALYRAGRQADALEVYQKTVSRLGDELGIDPGSDLRRVHLAILRKDPDLDVDLVPSADTARSVVVVADQQRDGERPHELPIDVEALVGRDALLAYGEAVLTRPGARRTPTVLCLYGGAGIGKSAAAARIGHRIAASFPDGELFVRLVDADSAPIPPRMALGRLLRALDVPADRVPDAMEERSALFRSRTAERALLVVLDDAQEVAQVRPLLPAGTQCGVIITSRRPLLGIEAAEHRQLLSLDEDTSLELLERVSGLRIDHERIEDLTTIVNRCAGLPLALRIVGARLAVSGGESISSVAAALSNERGALDVLDVGDLAVRASLDLTLGVASAEARRLHARIALLGIDEFSSWVAAPLLDCDEVAGDAVLEQLLNLGLIQLRADQPMRRFGIHSLVWSYAAERLRKSEEPEETTRAELRYLRAMLRLMACADDGIGHGFVQSLGLPDLGGPTLPNVEAVAQNNPDEWFRVEWPGACTAVSIAAARDYAELAAALALRVRGYLVIKDCSDEGIAVLNTARDAVHGRTFPELEARVLQAYFMAAAQHDDVPFDELAQAAERSVALARQASAPLLEMAGNWQIGTVALRLCDLRRALRAYQAALHVVDRNEGLLEHRGKALTGVADALRHMDEWSRAVPLYRQAASLELAPTRVRAYLLMALADSLAACRLANEALPVINESRDIYREIGDDYGVGYVDFIDGRIAVLRGEWSEARRLIDSAAACFLARNDAPAMREVRIVEAELALARGQVAVARSVLTSTLHEAIACDDKFDAHRLRNLLTSESLDAPGVP